MGKLIAKLAGAILAVVATAAIGFSRLSIPSETFWTGHPARLVVAVGWLAVWSVWDSVDRAVAAQRAKSERRYHERLREGERALAAALPLIWHGSGVGRPDAARPPWILRPASMALQQVALAVLRSDARHPGAHGRHRALSEPVIRGRGRGCRSLLDGAPLH